ncbi:MAG TPA: hypothetical protein VGC91_16630 [Pyrinomonadaceae bacterium]|jgi:hypothetical protein
MGSGSVSENKPGNNKKFRAKAQRRKEEARQERAALNSLAFLLCATSAFARDSFVRLIHLKFQTEPLLAYELPFLVKLNKLNIKNVRPEEQFTLPVTFSAGHKC